MRCGPLPSDLVLKVPVPEHRIHQELEVVARGWVAVKIYASSCLQNTTHLQEPDGHHAQIGLHPLVVCEAGGLDCPVDSGMVVCDQSHPGNVKIG